MIRTTGAAFGVRPIGAPPKAAPVCLIDIFMDIYGYIINIYGDISYTFLIFSIYIFPRYVPLSSMYFPLCVS